MPRVLLDMTVLATDSRLRGIGRYLGDLARGIAASGNGATEVLGVTSLPWVGRPVLTDDLAGAVTALTHPDNPILDYESWAHRVRFRLAGAARHAGASLLHVGHPCATTVFLGGCKRVITCHDLIPLLLPEHYLGWQSGYALGRSVADHRRYHSADHVIAVSSASAGDLMRALRLPSSKITVVHNGIDLTQWSAEPSAEDREVCARFAATGRYLLCVGAADWRKNLVGALAALARVRRHASFADVTLVWAGSLANVWKEQIQTAADALNIRDAVTLAGFVSDEELGALYRGALALLFVSRSEGFGYPIIEAMAAGCPVITSNCSSMGEIAGDAALTVDPERHEDIAAAILRAADPHERARLRAAGTSHARRFSIDAMARATLEVYRRLVD